MKLFQFVSSIYFHLFLFFISVLFKLMEISSDIWFFFIRYQIKIWFSRTKVYSLSQITLYSYNAKLFYRWFWSLFFRYWVIISLLVMFSLMKYLCHAIEKKNKPQLIRIWSECHHSQAVFLKLYCLWNFTAVIMSFSIFTRNTLRFKDFHSTVHKNTGRDSNF